VNFTLFTFGAGPQETQCEYSDGFEPLSYQRSFGGPCLAAGRVCC
jgi:hypothetical protein